MITSKKLWSLIALALIILAVRCAKASMPQTETRIKIAVIDTGVDLSYKELRPFLCTNGHKSLVDNIPLVDSDRDKHGTNVISLITKNLNPATHCVIVIKFYGKTGGTVHTVLQGIKYAVSQHVSYLNMSLGGMKFDREEYVALSAAIKAGVKIAVPAGNEHVNLDEDCNYFPACYSPMLNSPNFHVVGSTTRGVDNESYSSYGGVVKYWKRGTYIGSPPLTGTSQATAVHMGSWVLGDL